MKILKDITNEISSTKKRCDEIVKQKTTTASEIKELNRLRKRLGYLYDIYKYLEFNPTESFCKSELKRLSNIVDLAEKSWLDHYLESKSHFDKLPIKSVTEAKNEYLKEVELPLIRKQIKTLTYILVDANMNILKLTIKRQWFDLILSGEKKEEYRENKAYWRRRLQQNSSLGIITKDFDAIHFYNGAAFSDKYPNFLIECKGIEIGVGKSEWGAPDEPVFIIKLGNIIKQ